MKYTLNNLGAKLYGLTQFSKIGLFTKKFVILNNLMKENEIIKKLKSVGFKNSEAVAIRFSIGSSKKNPLNLPVHLGKFSLKRIAKKILSETKKKPYLLPYVHELISAESTCQLYCDGKIILIEIWPGRGAFKKTVLNTPPDIIEINNKIKIFRYLKTRKVENVKYRIYNARPYEYDYLLDIARKILSQKNKFDVLIKTFKPLLCDFFIESDLKFEFSAMQKTDKFDTKFDLLAEDYYVAKTFKDLEKYDGKKKLFFDIPLSRNDENWIKIFNLIKHFPVAYACSLTMHLAIIPREMGIDVRKAILQDDYEIEEYPTN